MAHLQDIAKELNLSVSLVSRVLNNRLGTAGVSPRTRQLIRQQAQRMGYRKHVSAAALAAGKLNIIGVFVHRQGVPGSGIIEAMVEGISDEASRNGQRLILEFFQTDEEFKKLCPAVHRNVLDGLVVAGVAHRGLHDDLMEIQQRGVPVVTVHKRVLSPKLPNVGVDQDKLMKLAVDHLIEQGCRRIAHIAFDETRHGAYRLALEQAGLPYRPELIYRAGSFSHTAGELAVADFAARGVRYDGLVGQSDQQAAGALNALVQIGRKVPRQIKVVGVDNSPFCEFSIVPLSSVSEEYGQRGRQAVKLLMRSMNGGDVAPVQIDPVLYIRQSSQRLPRTNGDGEMKSGNGRKRSGNAEA